MRRGKSRIKNDKVPIASSELVSKIMTSVKTKNTKPELLLRKALWENGIRGYRLHWKVPGKPDIAFPGKKIGIFMHGCFWHRCPYCKLALPKSNVDFWNNKFVQNTTRDIKKIKDLERMGWKTLTFWACQLKNQSFIIDSVKDLLSQNSIAKP